MTPESPDDGQGTSAAVRPRTVNLGRGHIVPYPEPSGEAASRFGKTNRRTETKPEVRLRSALHRRGLRFRKNLLLRCGDLGVRADVVFTRQRIAVFVDGCFWHGCPEHQRIPERNGEYWVPKLRANVERDRRVDKVLAGHGWTVVRVWEHDDVDDAADQLRTVVRPSTVVARTASRES